MLKELLKQFLEMRASNFLAHAYLTQEKNLSTYKVALEELKASLYF